PQGASAVGLVYVAVADARGAVVRERHLSGSRAAIREASVDAALELILEHLTAGE
ncbi:MAG: CinA family protein, partial [Microcella sp.]